MTPTFIITSAINTNVGAYDATTRLIQTKGTIESIYNHYPDARLVLIDGGKPIPEELNELFEHIKSRVHVTLLMGQNEQLKHLHDNFLDHVPNKHEMGGTTGMTKSVAELMLMGAVLDAIKNNNKLKPILETDRIFKISGRYQLSPVFDKTIYESDIVKGKYVFRQRDASWMDAASQALVGTRFGYASRLWSFDINLLDDAIDKINIMTEDCFKITNTNYVDIEHLLFKHISGTNPIELEHTHLYGNIGPNGGLVYD